MCKEDEDRLKMLRSEHERMKHERYSEINAFTMSKLAYEIKKLENEIKDKKKE